MPAAYELPGPGNGHLRRDTQTPGPLQGRLLLGALPRPARSSGNLVDQQHQPAVTAPIVGATKPHRVTEAVAAVDLKLSAAELERLAEYYTPRSALGIDRSPSGTTQSMGSGPTRINATRNWDPPDGPDRPKVRGAGRHILAAAEAGHDIHPDGAHLVQGVDDRAGRSWPGRRGSVAELLGTSDSPGAGGCLSRGRKTSRLVSIKLEDLPERLFRQPKCADRCLVMLNFARQANLAGNRKDYLRHIGLLFRHLGLIWCRPLGNSSTSLAFYTSKGVLHRGSSHQMSGITGSLVESIAAPMSRYPPDSLISRPPEASIIWTDPVTGRQGFLVIDRLVRGLASGGLRMRAGCLYEEVRDLAAAMTAKEALHYVPSNSYIPMGGAKGGIDCEPSSDEAPGMLTRFLSFIRPYLQQHWATGEDLGTTTEGIEQILDQLGIGGCIEPVLRVVDDPVAARERFGKAFSVEVGGIALPELVGGCGVAEATLTTLDRDSFPRSAATAVIQGFGCMGGATARFLHQAGVRVVGMADAQGTVANPNGLAVESMLRNRLDHGLINRDALSAGDILLGQDDWYALDADVLIPAAVSYAIDGQNGHHVRARYIVEAANLPLTAEADEKLTERGVLTIPGLVANSGTNAWWWWVLFGDVEPEAAASFEKVRSSLRALVHEILDQATHAAISPRRAARRIVDARYEALERQQGLR